MSAPATPKTPDTPKKDKQISPPTKNHKRLTLQVKSHRKANSVPIRKRHLMKQEAVLFPSASGKLAGVIHHPSGKKRGCVITCHGLLSSKDSDKFITLGELFAEEGLTVLRFDFSGCGESEGRFEDTTITGRNEDLLAALSFMQTRLQSEAQPLGILEAAWAGIYQCLPHPAMNR